MAAQTYQANVPIEPVRLQLDHSQRLMAGLLRVLIGLPPAVKRRLAGRPIERDGFVIDLDTQLLLRIVNRLPQPQHDSVTGLRERVRRGAALVMGQPVPIDVRDITVAGADGPLRARVYDPAHGDSLLVYFHGGGWVHGDLDTHDASCRRLARSSGVQIVAVDYRLAPEHPYPAAVDDALHAYRDIRSRASEFGVDANRVGVGGDSAGAYLAAVLSYRVAQSGGPCPLVQLLIYPPTDLADEYPSRRSLADGFLLTRAEIAYFDSCFLPPHVDRTRPEVSPLRAAGVAGLPATIVVTAGFDPLRDEGEAFAAKLHEGGVPLTTRRFDGFVHGFVSNPLMFRDAITEIGDLLAKRIRQATPGEPAPSPDRGLAG